MSQILHKCYRLLLKIRRNERKKRTLAFVKGYVATNRQLGDVIEYADNVSKATGADLHDYVALYEIIRREKPQYVLECGTGKSTLVIAQAMLDHCKEIHDGEMKLISMEHDKEWYEHAISVIPEDIKSFVEIHFSPMEAYTYSFIRGTVYQEIPDHPYELVFVDGPSQEVVNETIGKVILCNLDFVRLVQRSKKPVQAIIDMRKHTVLAYTLIFGPKKVKYFRTWELGIVGKVTSHDLVLNDKNMMNKKIFGHVANLKYGDPF